MAPSDSMFLVELIVEELKSYVKCNDFIIKSQFADVFSITLKNPNDVRPKSPTKKKYKRKMFRRNASSSNNMLSPEPIVQTGQSILFANNLENLMTNMRQYPIELSLWSKLYPEYKLASTNIPWNTNCIDYLNKFHLRKDPQPISAIGEYNVFDEFTSRRMATIKLNIKLTYLADKVTTQFKSSSEEAPDTFMNTGFNAEDTGIIKTIYRGGNRNKKPSRKIIKPLAEANVLIEEKSVHEISSSKHLINNLEDVTKNKKDNSSIISLVKSDTDIDNNKQIDLIKSKSCSSINREHLNIINYIFGDSTGPFGNQIYCVGYFTVENDLIGSPKKTKDSPELSKGSSKTSKGSPKASKGSSKTSKDSPKVSNPELGKSSDLEAAEAPHTRERITFKYCDAECPNKNNDSGSDDMNVRAFDIPKEAKDITEITVCKEIKCDHKKFRELPSPPNDTILLDLTNLKDPEEGDTVEKVEEVVGGIKAKMKIGEADPCYCECECRFGFTKKTLYCKVCGGYEKVGDDLEGTRLNNMPFPCPIYHKLAEKSKTRPVSVTGSDFKKKENKERKSLAEKSIESEKESKQTKKKKKDNKFRFNYGYTAPHIGHGGCGNPCTGTISPVPKSMGWLWNSNDIPGMKFRPSWKPGAVHKHVLRLLKIAKNPEEAISKKKRKKPPGKPKRPLKRPLLIVHKKDGEFNITMETMKTYNRPRALNQVPYEDKPAITYTVGRTDEENYQRRKKKERAARRLERDQREFIQSAFRDMCEDICLKTYQQALGILPDAEKPDCTCYPAEPGPDRTDLDHSCSCSEDSKLAESDTDSDEWILEFTPPTANFDPTYKSKKISYTDSSSQYTYLDYRVKLLDRFGNPVPRFFKGPDGKEQCSDLGGFWSPDHKWLEINIDGFIGPDGKWAPNNFLGPNGENVDAEGGKFQAMDLSWLVVGIDGYVDAQGKWQFYPKSKSTLVKRRAALAGRKTEAGDTKKGDELVNKKSEGTWSCFGDVGAKYLSELGIMGHGHDRKLLLDTLDKLIAQGEDVKIPAPTTVPRSQHKKGKKWRFNLDNKKCRHPTPSSKGIVAVDEHGNKTYFRLKDYKNKRPTRRIATLTDQGISVSSFHVPCFHSFISSEIMKKQQYDRLVALSKGRGQGHSHRRGPRQEQSQHERDKTKYFYEDKPYRNVIV